LKHLISLTSVTILLLAQIVGNFSPVHGLMDTEMTNSTLQNPNNVNLEPPLKQIKSGVLLQYVKCKEGFELLFKEKTGSPACVRPQTAQKLVERGWGEIFPSSASQEISVFSHSINITNTGLSANYDIKGGTVLLIAQQTPDMYAIKINATSNGILNITLPEYIVMGKIYVIGNHNRLLNYNETFDYDHEKRTLSISFNQDDTFIELASESKWKAITNPLPYNGSGAFP